MTLSLDHVVIRVRDLEQTIADYNELGFTVQRGGTHADGATHNALIGFADGSYFELIAFLRDAPEHRWWDADYRVGDGLVDFALLPEARRGGCFAARAAAQSDAWCRSRTAVHGQRQTRTKLKRRDDRGLSARAATP